jgi:xylulokinase
MSLLGIEVGTTGCRALAVATDGTVRARARSDYSVIAGDDGTRELDCTRVWDAVRAAIAEIAAQTRQDPVTALSVGSMAEPMTPLSQEGRILSHCILGTDPRGDSYLQHLEEVVGRQRIFDITGNTPGPEYALPKLCWLRDNAPELYQNTWRFVPWAALVTHLLGGASVCDYSLANRTLLFDITQARWSRRMLDACGLAAHKLPEPVPAGTPAGTVAAPMARDLGLSTDVRLVVGGHTLCCNALGAGVVGGHTAAYTLGASLHMMPTFSAIPLRNMMLANGLSMAHHVVPDVFVSFFYNRSGGRVLRWFRDALAPLETREVQRRGASIYTTLLAEMPSEPTRLMVLPHFEPTGPPHFDERSAGAILGLNLNTTRGEMIKALIEAMTYSFWEGQDLFRQVGIRIDLYRAMGGGSRSDEWLQLTADVLGLPVERTTMLETAPLGAAMLAGVGSGVYADIDEAVAALVRVERRFEPDPGRQAAYEQRLALYRSLYPLLRDTLHGLRAL